jgi:hypothetical protein
MTVDQLNNERQNYIKLENQRDVDQQQQQTTLNTQREIQVNQLQKQSSGLGTTQSQLIQLLANQQPVEQVQRTAQDQLSKGFLDVKI